jgi:hypothetical protein
MTAPLIAYERTVLVSEKDLLDPKKEALYAAFPDVPLICIGVDDSQNNRCIRVQPFYKRDQVLAQIPVEAIKSSDVESLQKRIAAGEFAVKS